MQQFEIKFNDSAETYGTLIGMTQEEEQSFVSKLKAKAEAEEEGDVNNSGKLFKSYVECASTVEEAIVAAFHAGVRHGKYQARPIGSLLAALL